VFNPQFVERLENYSVLRYMDWNATNNSAVTSWTQRTTPAAHSWGAREVPAEIMIALANRVGAHMWVNMPHQADDNYSQQFAALVKDRLDARLGVYAEYSNEVWNAMFQQYNYAQQQGAAAGLDNMQYYAQRSDAVGRAFKDALGSLRVVSLLCGQYVNTWTATHGLDWLQAQNGGKAGVIDSLCMAPYFAVTPDDTQAAQYDAMSLDQFFSYVNGTVIPNTAGYMQQYSGAAGSYGLGLVTYEGGQHMVGVGNAPNDGTLCALFDAFNRDPRIKASYLSYLQNWKNAAGQLFVHFNDVGTYTKWGRWGTLEYVTQPRSSAPKFDAVQTFIEQNPVWWTQ
jgi:hypothetical protein